MTIHPISRYETLTRALPVYYAVDVIKLVDEPNDSVAPETRHMIVRNITNYNL